MKNKQRKIRPSEFYSGFYKFKDKGIKIAHDGTITVIDNYDNFVECQETTIYDRVSNIYDFKFGREIVSLYQSKIWSDIIKLSENIYNEENKR